MSRLSLPPTGTCKQDPQRESCPLVETIGHRSDEPDPDAPADFDPKVCPFCNLKDLATGKNPCQQCSD